MRVPVWYVVLLAIILAQGCGYHLRGQSLDRGADKGGDRTPVAYRVHVIGAAGPLADALRARLVTAGATLSAGRKDADYTLTLHGEEFVRQVASVSPATGKKNPSTASRPNPPMRGRRMPSSIRRTKRSVQ